MVIYRATVVSLLGMLVVFSIAELVRDAQLSALAHRDRPTPLIVRAPATPASMPAATQIVDVRASELDRMLGNPGDEAAQTGDGLRIFQLANDGALAALGFEVGDVVRAANDESARYLFNTGDLLGPAVEDGHADFTLTRRGQPVRLVVLVHD